MQRFFLTLFSFMIFSLSAPCPSLAELTIHSQIALDIEIFSYADLTETSLFKGKLQIGSKQTIKTSYRGLALLVFAQGQSYPLLLDEETLTVQISSSTKPPSFPDSMENDCFYKALTDKIPVPSQYPFAALMIQAKNLLDSSHAFRTVAELQARKKEYCQFVTEHFPRLKHSDMIRRLIAQSFMMHEYVDYHVDGAPATDIKKRYQQEVLKGVADWLEVLSPHISKQEILNYCVSLYYKRSMITLASLITDKFKGDSYCPGGTTKTLTFPDDLQLLDTGKNKRKTLATIKGKKLLAFVSEQCPISMAATIIKARRMADEKQPIPLLVVPLEKLSGSHLSMNRMIRNGKLLFVSDEKWRNENLAQKIKLPLFVEINEDSSWEIVPE